ncbi:MAG: GGDEF domain-containing protein [Trueperaceae bacterium]|nr:GGDEF domain-containing protein [Trueperaceae bacterium]
MAPIEPLKRRIYSLLFILGWVSGQVAWGLAEFKGMSSLPLRLIFLANALFQPAAFSLVWRKRFPLMYVDTIVVSFVAGITAVCMALKFYSPTYSPNVIIEVMYLWTPIIYIFAFCLPRRTQALRLSSIVWTTLLLVSLPYLIQHPIGLTSYLTIQLHLLTAALIVAFYFFASFQRHLQLAQLNVEQMAELANTDSLTKLANRRRIYEVMNYERLRFTRYGHSFSVLLFDIDHFKKFNDQFGHDLGDKILIALAKRVKEVLRDVDTLGRWGGEEFIIILAETNFEEALIKAKLLCEHVAIRPLVDHHVITISCGVTEVLLGDNPDAVLQRADVALYEAKHLGRNRAEGMPSDELEHALRTLW